MQQGCGQRLGRFTLLRKLAQGGMAEVFLAQAVGRPGRSPPVAIKRILPQFSRDARFVAMLKDEAKITVSLTHPNIAQVYELGLANEDHFLVMEYVEGQPLSRVMRRVAEQSAGPLPIAHAVYVMSEVAKGLDHAHRQTDGRGLNRNIVHRDVSPQNVLLSYAGAVKLIDFGIARAQGRVRQTTSEGIIEGKLRYLAPEIAAGRAPDFRADIYCCGIVLFEMMTGEPMFAPQSDEEALTLAIEANVKSPRSRNHRVPAALDAIVNRALRKAPGDRFSSAHDLHLELQRFLRVYQPSYRPHDLAGLMRSLFRPEIVLARSQDAAALAYAEEVAGARSDRPAAHGSAGPTGDGYRQVVYDPGAESEPVPAERSLLARSVPTRVAFRRKPLDQARRWRLWAVVAVVFLVGGIAWLTMTVVAPWTPSYR